MALAAAAVLAGCTLQEQHAPSMTGPSEFGLAITLSATPDQVPRDGSSQSVVTVTVRDASGQPVAGQRLSVATNLGSVSQSQVVTGSDGRASFAYTAPASGSFGTAAVVQVVPVGDNANNAVPRSLSILLTGFSNPSAPQAVFVFSPTAPVLSDTIVFDANGTRDDGGICGKACTYAWNFGDGTSATGIVVSKTYSTAGNKAVTLTVVDAGGASDSNTQVITVGQPTPPSAGTIVFGPTPVIVDQTTNFDAGGATVGQGATIVQYTWVWGDGSSNSVTTSPQTTHAFGAAGTYTVRVTVRDSLGRTATSTVTVDVEDEDEE